MESPTNRGGCDDDCINGSIVSAIQLAEVAGLVASRSLGMKGTRIRILDRAALEEAVS